METRKTVTNVSIKALHVKPTHFIYFQGEIIVGTYGFLAEFITRTGFIGPRIYKLEHV